MYLHRLRLCLKNIEPKKNCRKKKKKTALILIEAKKNNLNLNVLVLYNCDF